MSEVVDRLARRMARDSGFKWENCLQERWRLKARNAIVELREPTEAMRMAGAQAVGADDSVQSIWQAMVEEALR